ncbi:MAG: hypothetical protein EA376_01835 [Phycisphaeraceae bacterium]|nr:MAG: hypothetical protein EA376_01835 [Phycisphaeraceae bacterium]
MARPLPNLAALAWHSGMLLDPVHFQWVERRQERLLAHARAAGLVAPWGFEHVQPWWDGASLGLESCRAVFPSGVAIAAPETDEVEPLTIGPVTDPGVSHTTIYLTAPRQDQLGRWSDRDALLRVQVEAADFLDDQSHPQEISVIRRRLRLARDGETLAGWDTLPVVRLRRKSNLDDEFEIDPTFIPPLLRVGASEVVVVKLDRLAIRIRDVAASVAGDLAGKRIGGAGMDSVTTFMVQKLQALNRVLGLLSPLEKQNDLHPFNLYVTLSSCLGELAFFGESRVMPDIEPYRHDVFGQQFEELRARFDDLLSAGFEPLFEPMPIALVDGRIWEADLNGWHPDTQGLMLAMPLGELDREAAMRTLRDAKVFGNKDVDVERYALAGLTLRPREHRLTGLPERFVYADVDLRASASERVEALRASPKLCVLLESPNRAPEQMALFCERGDT